MNRHAYLAIAAAAVAVFSTGGCDRPAPEAKPSTLSARSSTWNVTFEDVAERAGIDFTPQNGDRSPLTIWDVAPGGCAWSDFDGDGWLDAVLVGPPRCALYRNLGNGRFEDVTAAWGLNVEGPWMGCTVGDYDNDGHPDLLVTGYRRSALYRNERGRRFRDVTRAAGLQDRRWTTSAAFGDVDGDGWLDLYVGAYVDYKIGRQDHCMHGTVRTTCGPEAYPTERGSLYRNLRNGRFADVTAASGMSTAAGKTWGVAFADFDEDGRLDLYLANDQVPGNLFRNRGNWQFEDLGLSSGTGYDANGAVQGGMGIDWGDFNADGRFDLFVTTYARQNKELYLNQGRGVFQPSSVNVGLATVTHPYVAFGGGFFDPDNDGNLDLFIANGHIRDNAAEVDSSQSYAQPLQLLANRGDGTVADVSAQAGAAFQKPAVGRGVAFGDYDNDGLVDVLAVDLEGRARLLRNQGGGRVGNWLQLRLDAGKLNGEAIGARVWVEAAGRRRMRELTRGRSVLSACDVRAHFGLGSAEKVDRIIVRWPDGKKEEWRNLVSNKILTLKRDAGE